MMYFILWVVFLLFLILSVPIVSALEKRKRQAAFGPKHEEPSESFEEAADEAEEMVAEDAFEAVEETPFEGDGFAEFEEVK